MNTLASGADIRNCRFIGNAATTLSGGAMYMYDYSPIITNCTFVANTAFNDGDALKINHSEPVVTNNIFWGGAAGESGFAVFDTVESGTISYNCSNSIYANSTYTITEPPEFVGLVESGTAETITYDEVSGKSTLTHTGEFDTDTLAGLTLWVDRNNDLIPEIAFYIVANDSNTITFWGDASTSITGEYDVMDYSLRPTSPCIDTGADTSGVEDGGVVEDVIGVARPQDGDGLGQVTGDGSDYDIGAYEYVAVN